MRRPTSIVRRLLAGATMISPSTFVKSWSPPTRLRTALVSWSTCRVSRLFSAWAVPSCCWSWSTSCVIVPITVLMFSSASVPICCTPLVIDSIIASASWRCSWAWAISSRRPLAISSAWVIWLSSDCCSWPLASWRLPISCCWAVICWIRPLIAPARLAACWPWGRAALAVCKSRSSWLIATAGFVLPVARWATCWAWLIANGSSLTVRWLAVSRSLLSDSTAGLFVRSLSAKTSSARLRSVSARASALRWPE